MCGKFRFIAVILTAATLLFSLSIVNSAFAFIDPDRIQELEINNVYEYDMNEGDTLYFSFCAYEDVTVRFYSETAPGCDLDTFVWLFNRIEYFEKGISDKNKHCLATSDDDGVGNNFDMTYDYAADFGGTEYYLEVGAYGSGHVTIVFGEKPQTQTHTHSYNESVKTEPTCVSDGVMLYTCNCGHTYEESIPATNIHTFTDGNTDEKYLKSPATCLSGAVYKKSCSVCGAADEEGSFVYGASDPTKHDYEVFTKEPTCEEKGSIVYTCKICSNEYEEEIDSYGHISDNGEIIENPTCETDGEMLYTCTRCGKEQRELIPKTGHDFDEWTTEKAATCTKPGEEKRVCRNDPSHTERRETPVASENHSWDSGTVTTAPSCANEGEMTYICTECHTEKTETIAQLVHSFTAMSTDEKYLVSFANCSAGAVYHYSCANCGAASDETFEYGTPDTSKHDYIPKIIPPTCREIGYTIYECACGKSYIADETEKLGHDFRQTDIIEATCSWSGIEVSACSNCGEIKTKTLPVTKHSYKDEIVEATCEKAGYTLHTCIFCGDNYTTNETRELGHKFMQTNVIEATCSRSGIEVSACSNCGEIQTKTLPVTKHSYKDEIVEATCEKAGYTLHTCIFCGDNYTTDETKELGHKFMQTNIIEATCSKSGIEVSACSNCGEIQTKTLPMTEHSYKDELVAATCENGGYTLHTCIFCGDNYTTDETKELGHKFMQTNVIEATCSKSGIEVSACSNCGEIQTKTLPMTEHSYKDEIVEATCENGGYTLHTCIFCGDNYMTDETKELGHKFMQTNVIEATCSRSGIEVSACSNCGDIQTKTLPMTEHSYKDEIVEATCENGGYTLHTCIFCGDNYTTDETKELGHKFMQTNVIEANCNKSGIEVSACSNCGEIQTKTLTVTEHNYKHEVIAATCEKAGYTLHTCIYCGDNYTTDETAKLAHTYKEETILEADCVSSGIKRIYCESCQSESFEIISAKGHSFDKWNTVIKATCSSNGAEEAVCINCGETVAGISAVMPESHVFVEETVDPTCTKSGYTSYTCKYCGFSYKDKAVAASGHVDKNGDLICDKCHMTLPGHSGGTSTLKEPCDCNCHKSGITKFFWSIKNFFNMIFGKEQYCKCGEKHW